MPTVLPFRDNRAVKRARIIEALAQAIVEDYNSEIRPESGEDERPPEREAA